jgi:hypothetical protein
MSSVESPDQSIASVDYKGCNICVEIDPRQSISLKINGMLRESRQFTGAFQQTTKLSSSVQTDYEWHEFIVAEVLISQHSATVSILANDKLLLEKSLAL